MKGGCVGARSFEGVEVGGVIGRVVGKGWDSREVRVSRGRGSVCSEKRGLR